MADSEAQLASEALRSDALEMRVTRPGMSRRRLRLVAERATFGSGPDATVRLDDPSVAAVHAVLVRKPHQLVIQPQQGLVIVNHQVVSELILAAGVTFSLGEYTFEVSAVPSDCSVPAAAVGRVTKPAAAPAFAEQALGMAGGPSPNSAAPRPADRWPTAAIQNEPFSPSHGADQLAVTERMQVNAEALREEIERLRSELKSREGSIEESTRRAHDLADEVSRLQRVCETERIGASQALAERETLSTALAEQRSQLAALRSQNEFAQKELTRLREEHQAAEALALNSRAELQQLRDNLLEAFKRHEQAVRELEEVRTELNNERRDTEGWKTLRSGLEQAHADLEARWQVECQAHEADRARIVEQEQTIAELSEELSQLKQHHVLLSENFEQRVQQQKQELVTRTERLEQSMQQQSALEQSRRALEVELAQVCQALAQATEELDLQRRDHSDQESMRQRLEVMERELPEARLVAQREIDRLRDRVSDLESRLEAARLAQEDTNRACVDAEHRAQRLRDRLQENERELEEAATKLRDEHQRAQSSLEQVARLQASLAEVHAELARLQAGSGNATGPEFAEGFAPAPQSRPGSPPSLSQITQGAAASWTIDHELGDDAQSAVAATDIPTQPAVQSAAGSGEQEPMEAYMRKLFERVTNKPAELAPFGVGQASGTAAANPLHSFVQADAQRLGVVLAQPVHAGLASTTAGFNTAFPHPGETASADRISGQARTRRPSETTTKFAIAGLGMCGFLGMMFMNGFQMGLGMVAAVCCLAIAAIWSIDGWLGLPKSQAAVEAPARMDSEGQ
jgi:hypothetical protein